MDRFFSIRARIFLRRCRWGLAVIAAWFAFGTIAFYGWERVTLPEAILNALYLGSIRGAFWDLYAFWGQVVLFGIVISVFVLQALQQYNPQEGCRMLAREMTDHTIVVGYSHLGARIIAHLKEERRPFVLIERDSTKVDDLVRAGEPVIVDDAKEGGTLEEAGVGRARVVVIASNNIETALLVTKRARERNQGVRIIVRCFQDDFAEILEGLGADEVISSSKSAFREVSDYLVTKA